MGNKRKKWLFCNHLSESLFFSFFLSLWMPKHRRRTARGPTQHLQSLSFYIKPTWLLSLRVTFICWTKSSRRGRLVHLSPAANFSIAALRSSAFCCERRRTFLSSWRWSSVPTSSPFTVFIWLSSICVWWREFLLYRLLERTFSSRSSTVTGNQKTRSTHVQRSLKHRHIWNMNLEKKVLVCDTDPCSPGSPCYLY